MGVTGNKRERAEGTKGIKDRNKWKQWRQRSVNGNKGDNNGSQWGESDTRMKIDGNNGDNNESMGTRQTMEE